MLTKKLLTATCAALLVLAVARTGEGATLLLRSGERISGQVTDMAGWQFTVWSNGREERIPMRDVLVIDFTGNAEVLPDEELSAIQDRRHLIVLRNGRTVPGYLLGMDPTYRIRVRTDAGEQDYSPWQIERIYLGYPDGAVATTGRWYPGSGYPESSYPRSDYPGSSYPGSSYPSSGYPSSGYPGPWYRGGPGAISRGGMAIPGNARLVPTGISVRAGETLYFSSSGEVQLSTDPNDMAGIAGSRTGRFASGSPIPTALAGALIYRIGDSRAYPLGDQTQIRMPETGPLYIGINDDYLPDNQGQFYVSIRRGSQ